VAEVDVASDGAPELTVSLVTYCPDMAQLAATFSSFARAVRARRAAGGRGRIDFLVVDNSPEPRAAIGALLRRELGRVAALRRQVLTGHGNVGFGRGHNLALAREVGGFHLILNPDVEIAEDALAEALAFMEAHPECGLLTPAARWGDGTRQYLCKRYPSVLDLLLRGFAPGVVKRLFAARLAQYEMRGEMGERMLWDPPIVSGCFMLFRGELWRRLGGFDPGYFLYFEDFDLSLRTAAVSRIAYVPAVRIVHHGGHAARKGWRHVTLFGRSALRFFKTHGWRWF